MIRGIDLTNYAYMFEAKGIQRYIFASGKLRDVVGASDLVASLASGAGDRIGELLGKERIKELFADSPSFSRRAGGAFCVHSVDPKALASLRAEWRYLILRELPGLEFVDVIAQSDTSEIEAMRQCFRDAGGIRSNYPAEVPGLGRPITLIAPLTGRPAVAIKQYGTDEVRVDAIGLPQRKQADTDKLDRVAERFVLDVDNWKFPRNYDEAAEDKDDPKKRNNPLFPFIGDDKRIAVIHADLSGLGELFRNMGNEFNTAEQNFDLAKSIEEAIARAVRGAVACKILPHAVGTVIPARPVLLGGDDITIIVRADLAIPFTIRLLQNIETECKSIGEADGHKALSACAGIAIVGKGTPFLTAYALADDLCRHAKSVVKKPDDELVKINERKGYASAYSFHVYQHTALDGYEGTIAANDKDADSKALSANPYIVGARDVKGRARIDLQTLAQKLANVEGGHNRVREIKSLISDNRALAEVAWERWWEVGDKKQKDAIGELMAALGEADVKDGSSGIFDAMLLIDLGAVTKEDAA